MRSHLLTLLGAAVLILLPLSCSKAAEKTFDKKFTVSPGGTLVIDTDAGSVDIAGTAGNEVSISAIVKGRERDVQDFTITADQTSGGVEVSGKVGGHRLFHFGTSLDVKFTIHVPQQYNLQLKTSGGDLTIADVQGTAHGNTSGGDIVIKNLQGPVDMKTSGGTVRAQNLIGTVVLGTSGGDVDIQTVTGEVTTHTSGGNVTVKDVDGKVDASTSGGNMVVEVRSTNKGVRAETSGGNVTVLLAKNAAANIDASTSGGNVVCDLPVTTTGKMDEDELRGTINGGGELVRVRTSGGTIRIKALQ